MLRSLVGSEMFIRDSLATAHEKGIVFTVQKGEEFLDYENLDVSPSQVELNAQIQFYN